MDRAARQLDSANDPDASRSRASLEDRARALARPVDPPKSGALIESIVFRVAGERYAIPLAHVLEVARLRERSPVPGVPPPFVGVATLRDELIALIDLAQLLGPGRAEAAAQSPSRFLVIGATRPELGIVADEVLGTEPFNEANLVALPQAARGAGLGARPIVRGFLPGGLMILDIEALLADERLLVDHMDQERKSRKPGEEQG
jgi:purine-binding chemotaxis protein CheW